MSKEQNDNVQPEYDFSGKQGVRGTYYQQLRDGHTVKICQEDGTTIVQTIVPAEGIIILDPDVREYFSDAEAVNTALRAPIQLIPTKKQSVSPQ